MSGIRGPTAQRQIPEGLNLVRALLYGLQLLLGADLLPLTLRHLLRVLLRLSTVVNNQFI